MIPETGGSVLNNDLEQRPDFIIDPATGKITGYTTQEGGAGSVFPFKQNKEITTLLQMSKEGITESFGEIRSTIIKPCNDLSHIEYDVMLSSWNTIKTYVKLIGYVGETATIINEISYSYPGNRADYNEHVSIDLDRSYDYIEVILKGCQRSPMSKVSNFIIS